MAAIKSYTDIEQSKKLAEILPIESADMWFHPYPNDEYWYDVPNIGNADLKYNQLPCWSLAALLEVIPKYIGGHYVLRMDYNKDFGIWYDDIGYGVDIELPDITKDSIIDGCYEMILKLNELNLL